MRYSVCGGCRSFWFWQDPLTWVEEEMAGMGERIIMDSLRKVA